MELWAGADAQSGEAEKRQGREDVAGDGDIWQGTMQRATARSKMFGSHWGQTCTANTTSFALTLESKAST